MIRDSATGLTTARYGDEITLPPTVSNRYSLKPGVFVRIVETREGILLIPLTEEPMPEALTLELKEWQELGTSAWELFPYEEEPAS